MPIAGLDHFAILSSDIVRTESFYTNIVGLTLGYRPELSFPGIWLYAGDRPILHVMSGKEIPSTATGAVDHLAFEANGLDETLARLKANDIAFSSRYLERTGVTQVVFRDPDNVGVELNFGPGAA
jgi:catechol 2,3-dioxygenase-like lactoylglutathione lyase family enzyme